MTGYYVYTPQIWPSVLMVLLMLALSIYSARRRKVPGAASLAIASLFAAGWAICSLLESAAVSQGTKIFWFMSQAALQLPMITATTCFVLEYAWPGRWLTHRNLALLYLPVLSGILMILTDDRNHLAWRGFVINETVQPQLGPGSWLSAGYFLGILGVLNLIVFGWLFLRSPQQRWPVVLMLAGQLVGRMLFLLERLYLLRSVPPLDLTGISFEFLMYAIALFGFRIFDPIPLARRTAIEQLHAGMLVLDPQGRVASLNPAAEWILQLPARRLIGQPVRELLPAYPEGRADEAEETEIELSLGTGLEIRHYTLTISQLNDWRGLAVGRLLLMHDVTEHKRAQAQLVEQQRALAMSNEREQLARELHDSLGQVLGYTSLRMEAARKLISDGKLAAADNQLAQLEHIIADAHADVREYILNLRSAPSAQQPFFPALQHYLDGFLKNYGIRTDLSIGAGVDEWRIAPDVQMQLFRILQEAFSNARKHAQTDWVHLSFELSDTLARIRIQDNGKGFDPSRAAGEGHFGLRFMRERAEQLGGVLCVESAPEKGTCIVVEIPAMKDAETR